MPRCLFVLSSTLVLCLSGQSLAAKTPSKMALQLAGLRVEYKDSPIGIDVRKPRLSWRIQSDVRGASQTAYQIRVAQHEISLQDAKALVWDSGKIVSDESTQRQYEGPAPPGDPAGGVRASAKVSPGTATRNTEDGIARMSAGVRCTVSGSSAGSPTGSEPSGSSRI